MFIVKLFKPNVFRCVTTAAGFADCTRVISLKIRNYSINSFRNIQATNNKPKPLRSSVIKNNFHKTATLNIDKKHHPTTSISSALNQLAGKQQLKKRLLRKKRSEEIAQNETNGNFNVIAYATADEYDLEALQIALTAQDLYEAKSLLINDNTTTNATSTTTNCVSAGNSSDNDVLYVTAKYKIDDEPRDVLFFRQGSVVLWNCNEMECHNVLAFLRNYEIDSYDKIQIQNESEIMSYNYVQNPDVNACLKSNNFYLSRCDENYLEKYTFSNAMTTSVKLGIWEASLDKYIDSMEYVTDDLKAGRKIKMSRGEVLRKTGELFGLRHLINLSSDLLDVPDFYWDREQLEQLYLHTCGYFSISRRTKVMNEKLNHCVELAELISSNLNDTHHVRLEWMIIVLIMVEVGFEILHYIDRIV